MGARIRLRLLAMRTCRRFGRHAGPIHAFEVGLRSRERFAALALALTKQRGEHRIELGQRLGVTIGGFECEASSRSQLFEKPSILETTSDEGDHSLDVAGAQADTTFKALDGLVDVSSTRPDEDYWQTHGETRMQLAWAHHTQTIGPQRD